MLLSVADERTLSFLDGGRAAAPEGDPKDGSPALMEDR